MALGNGIEIKRYTASVSGVASPTYITTISATSPFIGEMDISADGSTIALANASGSDSSQDVWLVHLNASGLLDASTGNQGNGTSIFNVNNSGTGYFAGQEFSLNKQYLYVAHSTLGIYQLNLSTGLSNLIYNTTFFGDSQLEMAYHPTGDHKIYAAGSTGLGAILNPETSNPTFNVNAIPGATAGYDNVYVSSTRVLPDQMDGLDYLSYQPTTPTACCKSFAYDKETYTVSGSGSVTWTPSSNPFNNQTIVGIENAFIIPSGRTVTIKNMEFRFDEGAKVKVLPNAQLILDNTTFTTIDCETDRWDGIYVSGNTNASQIEDPQLFGTLILKNGAKLENAQQAVNNYGLTAGGNLNWNAIGGIVQATDAVFTIMCTVPGSWPTPTPCAATPMMIRASSANVRSA